MIYWKKGIYFGKTTETGLKTLRLADINVKTISGFYYHILCFIKYICMITLLPFILVLLFISQLCKYMIKILEVPINSYNDYF